jgi:hypothetical protein
MKATRELHDLGQSLWLDNITRDLLDNGTLQRYIDEFSITGLTSNPTIFEHAIAKSKAYDAAIGRLMSTGLSGEELFFELALQDLTRAADLFSPVHERTAGNDGFVSLEVSPLLANDTKGSVAATNRRALSCASWGVIGGWTFVGSPSLAFPATATILSQRSFSIRKALLEPRATALAKDSIAVMRLQAACGTDSDGPGR